MNGTFGRNHLYSVLLLGSLMNALIKPILVWWEGSGSLSNETDGLGLWFGLQPMLLLCLGLSLYHLPGFIKKNADPIVLTDWLIAFALILLWQFPVARLSWLALFLTALSILILLKPIEGHGRAGLVMLSFIAIRDPMSAAMMDLFASPFLVFDAWAAGQLLKILFPLVEVKGNLIEHGDHHSLLVLSGCASFKNLSYGLLIWFCALRSTGPMPLQFALPASIALAASLTILNLVRLAVLSISQDSYVFFHDEWGAQLFLAGSITIIMAFVWYGGRYVRD